VYPTVPRTSTERACARTAAAATISKRSTRIVRLNLLLSYLLVIGIPSRIAKIQVPKLLEASGLAASRRVPDVYWSHNDSGAPSLFAFSNTGNDWEDMAAGPGPERRRTYLYVGDIGDNERVRTQLIIYRVFEPEIGSKGFTEPAKVIPVRYPDGPHDAETLLIHPVTAALYIITKARGTDQETLVFKLSPPYEDGRVQTMQRVAVLRLPDQSALTLLTGRITGGSISPDGKSVVLCDYFRGYTATIESSRFDDIWSSDWKAFSLGRREQGEAICYSANGKSVLATSEGPSPPLIQVILRK
jgi:hypothetical protein